MGRKRSNSFRVRIGGYVGGVKLPRAVLALALVSLLTDVSTEMIYPLLPVFMRDQLGATVFAIGALEGAAESVSSLLKLVSGWWSDRSRRRKPLVLLGYFLASATRPLVGLAATFGQVAVLRLTDRMGKGIRTAPRDALIADAVAPEVRGRAFGFHRAADHLGAVIGPLVALLLMQVYGVSMRTVFLLAAVPAALAMAVLLFGVKESAPAARDGNGVAGTSTSPLPLPLPRLRLRGTLRTYLVIVFLFTLGNSTDAFLLLRATDAGVPVVLLPVLWSMLHAVKSLASTPSGVLSDRIGRRPLIVGGWVLYAAVYWAFGHVTAAWEIWGLFALYGIYFGLTEGVEKALVADLSSVDERGAAFGWYHLLVGLGALPASALFGAVWQWRGPAAAFNL
ncbi:MAG: MFS transporter, partial [Gemmatimonadaceae bacterium]